MVSDERQWIYRRLGRFELAWRVLELSGSTEAFEIMGHFIVIRAEFLIAKNALDITAYSPLFRDLGPVEEGRLGMIPHYEITVIRDQDRKRLVLKACEIDARTGALGPPHYAG